MRFLLRLNSVAEIDAAVEVDTPEEEEAIGEVPELVSEPTQVDETPKPEVEDIPDWLQDIAEEQTPETVEETPVEELEIPEFEDADAAMAWMESLAAKQGVSEDELLTSPEERSDTPPEWVQDAVSAEADLVAEIDAAVEVDTPEEEAIGVIPESLVELTPLDEIIEPEVEEVQRVTEIQDEQPPVVELSENLQETISPKSVETEVDLPEISETEEVAALEDTTAEEALVAPDFDDADAAMAWLESLAAKQGVSEDELLTSPEERSETPPEWVQDAAQSDEILADQDFSDTVEEIQSDESEMPDWVLAVSDTEEQTAEPETIADILEIDEDLTIGDKLVSEGDGEIPEWILETPEAEKLEVETEIISEVPDDSPEIVEVSASDIDAALVDAEEDFPDFDDADAAMAWLESLAAKQGVSEEELLTTPEERSESPPDWVQESVETEAVAQIEDISEPEIDSIEEEDLSDWLAKVSVPPESGEPLIDSVPMEPIGEADETLAEFP